MTESMTESINYIEKIKNGIPREESIKNYVSIINTTPNCYLESIINALYDEAYNAGYKKAKEENEKC